MKIKDEVFMVDTDTKTITKTSITGVKDELIKVGDTLKIVKTFAVRTGGVESSVYGAPDSAWVGIEDLFTTLEAAKTVIEQRIRDEIIEQLSDISIVDHTGGRA